jgi:hypothetical protein
MSEHSDWAELRERRMAEPNAVEECDRTRAEPTQIADETAVAALLKDAMVQIRFELAPLRDDIPERRRMHNAWILADLCHNLPAWLDPSRRANIREILEYEWRKSSGPRRAWMRRCWDRIGYDYSWLPEKPGGGPEADRGWQDPDHLRNDLGYSDHDTPL